MAMIENVKKMRETGTMMKTKGVEHDVEFTFSAPEARKVCLAGTFNAWNTNSLPMRKGKDGVWRLTIKLSPGRHEYKYFVDNAWAKETPCSDKVSNPFGTENCIIGVE